MPEPDISSIGVRVAARRVTTYPPGATFGPRTLPDHEFVWMLEGTATWTCDGRDIVAPPGTVLLGRPGMTDTYRWDPDRQTRHAYFHFTVDDPDVVLPPPRDWPLAREPADDDVIPHLFSHLLWLSDPPSPGAERLVEHAARHILVAFVTGASGTRAPPRASLAPPLERAVLYVRERWRRDGLCPVPIDDLAAAAAVSAGHLSRLFRDEVGIGAAEALRALRLEQAAVMLARTNLPVQEVAALTGFPNQFHFSRRFKQAFGRSPRAFRSAPDVDIAPRGPGLALLASHLLDGVHQATWTARQGRTDRR